MIEICEQCELAIPQISPLGLCPVCTLRTPQKQPTAGPEIPGYEVVRVLGKGGFGEVYECVQLSPAVRCVAVKVLKTNDAADKRRIADEIQVLGELAHPGIATLLGKGELDDGRPYYAMELCEGMPFDDWIQHEKPPMQERVKVLKALSDAVAYIHSKGVFHRDITPSNILVSATADGQWQPKLIDFGLSRATLGPAQYGREETLQAKWAGTPLWMAPEQLAGGKTGAAVDIHALGLLLGLALLEKPPFGDAIATDASWGEWLAFRKAWYWPKEPRIPRTAASLVWVAQKELSLDPADRSTSATELGDELSRWLSGQAVHAGRRQLAYRLTRTIAQHPETILAAGLLLLSLATLYTWRDRHLAVPVTQPREYQLIVDRAEADRLHAMAYADLQQGQISRAVNLLKQAKVLDADNHEVAFALDMLQAMAPLAKPIQPVPLPTVARRVIADPEGFIIEDYQGEQYQIHSNGTVQKRETRPLGDSIQHWKSPTGSWEAFNTKAGQIKFINTTDGLPMLHPINLASVRTDAAIHFKKNILATTSMEPVLLLWDLSEIGASREFAAFSSKVTWMAFEREAPNLWIAHEDANMRAWNYKKSPGFAAKLPIFDLGINNATLGESHANGIAPGWDGPVLMASLAFWKSMNSANKVLAVAGARATDRVAFAANDNSFLHWNGKHLITVKWNLPPVAALAIDPTGQMALWCGKDLTCWWIDLDKGTLLWQHKTSTTPVDALLMTSVGGKPLAAVACADGSVETWQPGLSQPTAIYRAAGQMPGKHPCRIEGLYNQYAYIAGVEGELRLRVVDAQNGKEIGEAISFQHGIGNFFTTTDGATLIAVDQKNEGPAFIRLISMRTRRDLIPPLQHPEQITSVSIGKNGKYLATACKDGYIRRWTLATSPN